MQRAEKFSINVTREDLDQFGDVMMHAINQLELTLEVMSNIYDVLWSAVSKADRLEQEAEKNPCDNCTEPCPNNEKGKAEKRLREEKPHMVPPVEEMKTMTVKELLQMAAEAGE